MKRTIISSFCVLILMNITPAHAQVVAPDADVLHHAGGLDEAEVLVHEGKAEARGFAGAHRKRDRVAMDHDR